MKIQLKPTLYKKDKIFTEEELLKVTELGELFSSEVVAKHFDLSSDTFRKLKALHPELKEAYQKGATVRIRNGINARKADPSRKLIRISERRLDQSTTQFSPQDAMNAFQKQFKENRERQLRQELRDIDLI